WDWSPCEGLMMGAAGACSNQPHAAALWSESVVCRYRRHDCEMRNRVRTMASSISRFTSIGFADVGAGESGRRFATRSCANLKNLALGGEGALPFRSAADRHDAGPRHLHKADRQHEADEGLDLVAVAGDLEHEALGRGVDDAGAEGAREPQRLHAVLA